MTDHFGSKLEGNIDIPEGEQNFKGYVLFSFDMFLDFVDLPMI